MSKRTISDVDAADPPPDSKRQKISPSPTHSQVVPDVLVQRSGIIQMSKSTDAPFRLDDRGDVDCSLGWCTYTHPEHSKAYTKGLKTRIIELFITPDKLVFPSSVAMFNGFIIFEHGQDKIKGRVPFLSSMVRYEITIVEDSSQRPSSFDDGFIQCVIIKCRWRIPELDDQILSDLLSETGVACTQESLDCVRAGIIKFNGYDKLSDTYNPKILLASLTEPKDVVTIQDSVYMTLRYCAPAILLYGQSNTSRTSYNTLMGISKCLMSETWYYMFFQWFNRIPETFLPQETRFLRELTLADLPMVKHYFCIQPSDENTMIEQCIKLYHYMKIGPYKNRDTLCHFPTLMKTAWIAASEDKLIRFATKKLILRTEEYPSLPGRWVLTFGDFDTEKRIIGLFLSLKKKEKERIPASDMFDMEYIENHKKLDDVQKGILRAIVDPNNSRRLIVFIGSAGSGKTTIIKALLESAKSYIEKNAPPPKKTEFGKTAKSQDVPDPQIGVFTAYGFMAATIRNSTGHGMTMTMSRAIAIMDIEENVSKKIELQSLKIVIIDEMSTANMTVVSRLLASMTKIERLFFFGDPQQMPPIERGSICECFTRMFKAADIDNQFTITQNPDCTIFNMKKNYRQSGNHILLDNFEKILNADASLNFKVVSTLGELRTANHPFLVIPIPSIDNVKEVTRAVNIIAQEYLQSADDSQRILLMAQRNEDVTLLKECLQSCDTYIKQLMPSQSRQSTIFDTFKPASRHGANNGELKNQKNKSRPLVVGELVKTTMNWYSRQTPGVPNVDYCPTGKMKTVPLSTSSLSNNDIGILHAIYDVNMANGCIIKSHNSTAAPTTRSTRDIAYARVMVLRSPNSKTVTKVKKTKNSAPGLKKERKKKEDTEYLFINNREYALANVVPRDVTTITVSQGQETEVSCLYLPPHMFKSETFERSQFYTGVTRARKMVILITPVVNGRLPAVENILSNDTIPGKTNFVQKYDESIKQANL